MHRHLSAIVILLAATLVVASCRSTSVSRLGIESSVFEQNAFVLITDEERGEYHVVTPDRSIDGDYMVAGQPAIVFHVEEIDDRTLLATPLTPGTPVESTIFAAEPTFHATVADAVAASGRHGVLAGQEVTWAGEAPSGPRTVVAIDPGRIVAGEWSFVTNVGTWDSGTVSWFTGQPADGSIILTQGAPLSEKPTVARLGEQARQVSPAWASHVDGALPPNDAYLFQERAAPLARRAGGELYVTIWKDRVYIGSTETVSHRGVPFILGSHPLGVGGTATEVSTEMRGLVAMTRHQPLAAAGFFDSGDLDIHGNIEFARLGLAELVADGGYYPFARARLLADGPIEGARRISHARILHRAGMEQAREEGAKAYAELLEQQGQGVAGARGSAATLVAQIDAQNGNWKTASAVAEQAAQNFREMEDAIRAARAELFAGEAATIAGDDARGTKLANQARSRFYHGQAPYQSALAEVSLAHIYLRTGDVAEATKMADYASRRFASTNDTIARNRALIALSRTKSDVAGIEAGLTRAVELGDEVGALDASAALVELSGVPADERAAELLAYVAHGFPLIGEPIMVLRATEAASKLCDKTGGTVGGATLATQDYVAQLCGKNLDLEAPRVAVSSTELYRHLVRGEYESANRKLERLPAESASFEDGVIRALTRHLAGGEAPESVHGASVSAFTALEPNRRWEALVEAAEMAERVGSHDLAALWSRDASDAIKVADELPSVVEARANLARRHTAMLMQFERPLEASNAAEEALVGMAAVSNLEKVAKASLAGFGAVAAASVGATADVEAGRKVVDESLEGLSAAEIADARSQLAWFAARNGAETLAKADLKAAKSAQAKVPAEQRSATVIARIAVTEGTLAYRDGDRSRAFKTVSIWFDNPGADGGVASDLWELTLRTAPSDELREGFADRLRAASPELRAVALGVLANRQLESGDAAAASAMVQEARDIGSNPTETLLLDIYSRSLTAPESTEAQAKRLAQTTQLTPIGVLAHSQYAAGREAALEWASKKKGARGISDAARARAELLESIATVKPVSQPKTKGLQDDVETALETRNAEVIVPTVVVRVEDLIDTGRAEQAETVLGRTESWFENDSSESKAELARLRLAMQMVSLRPVAVFERSDAVLQGLAGASETEATIRLLIAKNDLLLGLDARGEEGLRRALEAARTAKARSVIKEIESLADTFDIPLDR